MPLTLKNTTIHVTRAIVFFHWVLCVKNAVKRIQEVTIQKQLIHQKHKQFTSRAKNVSEPVPTGQRRALRADPIARPKVVVFDFLLEEGMSHEWDL